MKKKIHPKYNKNVTVTCACGNKFSTGSTRDSLKVELCSACHPFYTGKQKLVDTENLVKKFEAKKKAADSKAVTNKKDKKKERRANVSLKDMLKDLKGKG